MFCLGSRRRQTPAAPSLLSILWIWNSVDVSLLPISLLFLYFFFVILFLRWLKTSILFVRLKLFRVVWHVAQVVYVCALLPTYIFVYRTFPAQKIVWQKLELALKLDVEKRPRCSEQSPRSLAQLNERELWSKIGNRLPSQNEFGEKSLQIFLKMECRLLLRGYHCFNFRQWS